MSTPQKRDAWQKLSAMIPAGVRYVWLNTMPYEPHEDVEKFLKLMVEGGYLAPDLKGLCFLWAYRVQRQKIAWLARELERMAA